MARRAWEVVAVCTICIAGAPGCATALSSFEPAHVSKQGTLGAELGVDVSYPTGTVRQVIDAARSVEKVASTRALSDAEKRKILEGGVALAVNPPAAIPHAGATYVPVSSWELGLGLASSGWRLSVRHQLLEQASSGIDLTIGIGAGTALFAPPVDAVLDRVKLDSFRRVNLDLPIALGRHGSWYRWWLGPRLLYSNVAETTTLTLPNESRESASVSGHGFYLGGTAGAALGYGSVFVGPELTLVQLFGSADVNALGTTTNVPIDSFVVYPAFGVMGQFE